MKLLQTDRDALLTPLQAVTGIVEKRHTLPILSNVLIERKLDALTLLATDLEIQISTQCEASGNTEPKSLTVSADRKSTRLNSSHIPLSRMPSSA